MNLRIHPWKRKIIFQTIIFRCYVNLWGCTSKVDIKSLRSTSMLPDETLHNHEAAGISKPEQREIVGPSPEVRPVRKETNICIDIHIIYIVYS